MWSVRTSLLIGVLLSCVLAGTAQATPVSEVTTSAEADNLFTTVGITTSANRAKGEIYPPDNAFSLPAEEMPPSKTVGAAPNDDADNVPLRMPDTSGNQKNLAAMRGQVYTLREEDQKPYAKLHFFGMTADGGPAGGDFVLTYEGGATATINNVYWPDWCQGPTETAHWAIGPLTQRYRSQGGGDGAPCGIFHFPANNPDPTKKLISVTLPAATENGGANTQSYLMALTLEDAEGVYKLADLSGQITIPNDNVPPETTVSLEPGAPNGNDGWYKGPVRVTLTGTDNEGGAGVEQLIWRVDGGPPQGYGGPFDYTVEGDHELEYRSIDAAGNAEDFKSVPLKVDVSAPTVSSSVTPGEPRGPAGWYDAAVTVRLTAADGPGSGVAPNGTRYRIDGGAWTPYAQPVGLATAGRHTLEYAASDVAGNEGATQTLDLNVDATAPTTTLRLNGADPVADYTSAVRVVLLRSDGEGSGAETTEFRLDGGAWQPYTGAFDVTGLSGHKLDYRSTDVVGNVENFKTAIFTVRPPQLAPVFLPQATPAPKPKPSAAIGDLRSRLRTVSALRRGKVVVRISCQGVDRGTLRLTVRRSVAKRLKLKSTQLARRSLRCGAEGRATLTLKPSSKVRSALARTRSSITATLTLSLRGSAGSARDKQTVTFRGKQS
jgi:hypothetical protein